jgi:hypothetical protein
MLILAAELGYKHSQASSYVDVFTKGQASPVVFTWGAGAQGHLLSIAKGTTLVEGKGSMLQRGQNLLAGKEVIALTKKWAITPAKKAEATKHLHTQVKEVAKV